MSNLRKIHICHLTLSSQELRNWRMGCRGVFLEEWEREVCHSIIVPGATETTEMEDLQVGIKTKKIISNKIFS